MACTFWIQRAIQYTRFHFELTACTQAIKNLLTRSSQACKLGPVQHNFDRMHGTAQRRVEMINGHFDIVAHPSSVQSHLGGPSFDVQALQRILEHDNFETRQKMKELMKQDLFVP